MTETTSVLLVPQAPGHYTATCLSCGLRRLSIENARRHNGSLRAVIKADDVQGWANALTESVDLLDGKAKWHLARKLAATDDVEAEVWLSALDEIGTKLEIETKPGTIEKCRSRLGLRELDASELAARGAPVEPESLPLLETPCYILKGWGHIVAGLPKAGKTELVFACVRDWLERGLVQSVLWLAEEGEHVWQQRLAKYPDFPSGLHIVFALGADPEELLDRAVNGDEEVVILDTVRNLLQLRDENDNAVIAGALTPWEAALQSKTRLYLHHERKMGGEHGLGIAGGGAFVGVVDRVLELKYDEHARNRRKLSVLSRITNPDDLLYEMTEDGELVALGNPNRVTFEEVKNRLVDVVNGDWQTTKQIHELLDDDPKPSSKQVREALNSLYREGLVERDPAEDRKGATYRWRAKPNLERYSLIVPGQVVDDSHCSFVNCDEPVHRYTETGLPLCERHWQENEERTEHVADCPQKGAVLPDHRM